MSIGFTFKGKVRKRETLLETIREISRKKEYNVYSDEDGVRVALCLAGGDLNINWKPESGIFSHYVIEGSCQSTPAGPGFHKAAIEFIDGLGIKSLEVIDETGYYVHRDFERMKREHFYKWLGAVIDLCNKREDLANICLCWDVTDYMPEEIDNSIVTPLGRFTKYEINEIVKQLGIRALAERFFVWNEPEKDARFYLNQAMNLLWESCYFAPSDRSQEDKDINDAIIRNMERAARLNPSLAMPRKAYKEVCRLAGHTPALPEGSELTSSFTVGYRKALVTYQFGSMKFAVPGRYRHEWEAYDDKSGVNMWLDTSTDSPIWRINGWNIGNSNDDSKKPDFIPFKNRLNDIEETEIDNGKIKWGWNKICEGGESYYQVQCQVVAEASFYFVSVTCDKKEEIPEIVKLIKRISVIPSKERDVNEKYY